MTYRQENWKETQVLARAVRVPRSARMYKTMQKNILMESRLRSIRWILIAVFALLAGFFTVQYLVVPPAQMSLYAILLAVAVLATIFVLVRTFKGRKMILAGLFALACLIGGYVLANAAFLGQVEERTLPVISRTDGGDGHTAILYFTHGEPPGYSAMPWIETMRELDRDNAPFVPWFVRPIFFSGVRNEYFEAGGSAHNELHKAFLDDLKRAMPEAEANGTKFYLAFLDSNPRPDEMVIRAINDGASKIIVLQVFITESTHTLAGKDMIASVHPEKYGVEVYYSSPLWDSDPVQKMWVERANEMTGGINKSKVGILLVGHGQPTEWEKIYPAQNQQENQYRQAIREKLIADGFSPEHVVLSWMQFQEPTITESAKELAGSGVEKILVFSVSLSADSIHSEVEVPAAVARAELPNKIVVEYVGQYCDHPLAIQAMIEKIVACQK